jgi:hypothetical protein
MWHNTSSNRNKFDESELLILKRALGAYKRELEEIGIAEVKVELQRVESLQLRFLGIKDEGLSRSI